MEEMISITSQDLAEHANLIRKRNEAEFRKDFLLRKGAKEGEEHIIALSKQVEEIEARLAPVEEKLKKVDIITVVPNRAEITALTAEVGQHPKEKLDEALKSKKGEVYELLKKRAAYTKANYENREQIARLVILINSLARKEAQNMKAIVESNASEVVDVSSLAEGQRQDLINTLGRIGVYVYISGGKLNLDKKKLSGPEMISWAGEVQKKVHDVSRGG